MIRVYELFKRRGTTPRLVVKIQRFPHDVEAWIKYYFADGHYEFKFPSSYIALQVADEISRFFELVNSPHWLAEIKSCCRYIEDAHNYDNDLIPF